ncbi:MAG: hypothetical protein R3249_05245 [Nitriliruptorales bacterium]|nr:hypothetical protein [Nitriliruptorales bacterium]
MTAPWDRRSDKERERAEDLVLRSWLPAVADFSPYWGERVRGIGLGATDFRDREALLRLAPVRELDVQRAGGDGAPALLMRPTIEQVKTRATGSVLSTFLAAIRREGTDGARHALLTEYKPIHVHRGGAANDLAVAYSRSDLDRLHRCGARAASVLGLNDSDYLVSAIPAGPTLDFFGVYHLALGSSMLALHPRGHGDPLERVVESFALIPTTVVAVHPGEAVELAGVLADADANVARVDTIVLVGPPPAVGVRDTIRDAWVEAGASASSLKVRSLFAPSEGRAMWAEDAEGGLVTYPDLEVLEVIDPVTLESTDGAGELVITSAGWHGTALLRYRTGVYVEGIDADGGDGRTVPRLVGRVQVRAWQPTVTGSKGDQHVLDVRGVATAAESLPIESWRAELRGPTSRIKSDRFMVELAGELSEEQVVAATEEIATQTGVWPAKVVAVDPSVVATKISEDGSAFVDLR